MKGTNPAPGALSPITQHYVLTRSTPLKSLLVPLIILLFSSTAPGNANPTAESDTTENVVQLSQ